MLSATAYADQEEIERLVKACPAGLYKCQDGKVVFSHEGCLECGTCRVVSGGKVVDSWTHPIGGMGVEYRKYTKYSCVKSPCPARKFLAQLALSAYEYRFLSQKYI